MSKQMFMASIFGKHFTMLNGVAVENTANFLFKIEIKSSGYGGHYDRVSLTVIGKNQQNVVERQEFIFDDYLTPATSSRKDYKTFEVIDHCGWEWYILTPSQKSINTMIDRIKDYINLYK